MSSIVNTSIDFTKRKQMQGGAKPNNVHNNLQNNVIIGMSARKPSGNRLASSQPPVHQRGGLTILDAQTANQKATEDAAAQNFINIHDQNPKQVNQTEMTNYTAQEPKTTRPTPITNTTHTSNKANAKPGAHNANLTQSSNLGQLAYPSQQVSQHQMESINQQAQKLRAQYQAHSQLNQNTPVKLINSVNNKFALSKMYVSNQATSLAMNQINNHTKKIPTQKQNPNQAQGNSMLLRQLMGMS